MKAIQYRVLSTLFLDLDIASSESFTEYGDRFSGANFRRDADMDEDRDGK